MLRLKLATEPRWVAIAEGNLEEALTDHAYCEQKAASTAISIIIQFPEYTELVEAMAELAQEEMEHFQRVHREILKRGWTLGRDRKDPYIQDLRKFFPGGDRKLQLIQKLLFAAMVEARSCERFKVLSEHVKEAELAEFYRELMESEAAHYTMFLKFARQYGNEFMDVDALWGRFLEYEKEVVANYGKEATVHG